VNKWNGVSTTALKALHTLEIVADSPAPVSVQEVANRLVSDKATAYRMLVTLLKSGFVVRDEASKRYSLSYKVVSLSRNLLAENEVSKLIQREMRELSLATQETIHYSVLDGHKTVLVQRVKGIQLVNVDFQIGDRSPLHCTAIGKVILAFQDVRLIEEVIAAGLPKMASKTITEAEALRQELRKIRSQGYAVDNHEYSDTMRCIAVPVFEGNGHVSSGISISGPESRFSCEKLDELSGPILNASRNLSRQLGGIPWHE
jgi:DNA-binding IclR family transcriptional regulator